MNPVDKFDSFISEIRHLHSNESAADYVALRPILQKLLAFVKSQPEHRGAFVHEFEKLVGKIDYMRDDDTRCCAKEVIDFCMRDLKWPEIERALKERYAIEPSPAKRLWLEKLIRCIYDPKWEGGVCESIDDEPIWDF